MAEMSPHSLPMNFRVLLLRRERDQQTKANEVLDFEWVKRQSTTLDAASQRTRIFAYNFHNVLSKFFNKQKNRE